MVIVRIPCGDIVKNILRGSFHAFLTRDCWLGLGQDDSELKLWSKMTVRDVIN